MGGRNIVYDTELEEYPIPVSSSFHTIFYIPRPPPQGEMSSVSFVNTDRELNSSVSYLQEEIKD